MWPWWDCPLVHMQSASGRGTPSVHFSQALLWVLGGERVPWHAGGPALSCPLLSGWPILLGLTGIPAALQLLTLPYFPESPRYLLLGKKNQEAARKGNVDLSGWRIRGPCPLQPFVYIPCLAPPQPCRGCVAGMRWTRSWKRSDGRTRPSGPRASCRCGGCAARGRCAGSSSPSWPSWAASSCRE